MLIESVRTFTTEEVEEGVYPRLHAIQAAVYRHGDDVEWPLDVRALMVLPEEQGKGTCIEGVEVDLGLDPVFLFSRLDIFGPDDQPLSTIEPALRWVRQRIGQMAEPAVIITRSDWIVRFMLRDQRRIESELDAHIEAALAALSRVEQSRDRIVPESTSEDDDAGQGTPT